jgi:UDP-N-acetylmuramate dehydrogenase
MLNFKENILLSEYTTIKLGGKAKLFLECNTENELIECLGYARDNNIKIQILSGGSNTVFSDEGFDGLIIKINIKGISVHNSIKNKVILKAGAGENWDEFVQYCINNNLTGVECLSGIPGSVGATPIQNVGAYGQEVKDTIMYVKAIDRKYLKPVMFSNEDCEFGYRLSRFKIVDKNEYIITEVMFEFVENGKPEIKYPELKKLLENSFPGKSLTLTNIRESVLELRKKKSMVVDENDLNSISCGSFFVNPVLTEEEFDVIIQQYILANSTDTIDIPFYKTENGIKIPAAWLIENSGFPKGFRINGIGISKNHNLALINCGGNTKDLINFANEIKNKVYEKFKIMLEPEPIIVDF